MSRHLHADLQPESSTNTQSVYEAQPLLREQELLNDDHDNNIDIQEDDDGQVNKSGTNVVDGNSTTSTRERAVAYFAFLVLGVSCILEDLAFVQDQDRVGYSHKPWHNLTCLSLSSSPLLPSVLSIFTSVSPLHLRSTTFVINPPPPYPISHSFTYCIFDHLPTFPLPLVPIK